MPDYLHETDLLTRGARHVAGVDEVGRGPLAGPVIAAAVILDPGRIPEGLNDSKALSAKRREALAAELGRVAIVSVGSASVAEIDEINILWASHLAMRRALAGLATRPCHALIDGHMEVADIPCSCTPLVKGDGRSLSIAAASIIAKVWRDNLMVDLAQHHPGYGWEKNAGYATKTHRDALSRLGVTPHHRRSFKTVHNIL